MFTGVATETVTYDADLVVMCGPLVPDVGFLPGPYAGGEPGGSRRRRGLTNQAYLPPPSAQSTDAIACLCMDVSGHDVAETIEAGMGHIELIKRFTKLGKSACQGRMCQTAAMNLCSQISGQTIAQVGTTVARPPAPPVTLGVLAGMRHHPVRRTPMHDQHDRLGAVWMDMGEWKRPRYYDPLVWKSGPVRRTGIPRGARTCRHHRRQHPGQDRGQRDRCRPPARSGLYP